MTAVLLDQADLAELLTQVWASYVDEQPLLPAVETTPADWTASVAVNGVWHGSVVVELSDPAAREIATLMLDTENIETDEMLDAIGELANIIGGNVKSLMPEPSVLALPTVVCGSMRHPGELVCSLPVQWHGHPVHVQMFRTEEEPTP